MMQMIATRARRLVWAALIFLLAFGTVLVFACSSSVDILNILANGEIMPRIFALPALASITAFTLLTACASNAAKVALTHAIVSAAPSGSLVVQVVGVQWLNPLQRRDYPTEWQLLWTLGMVKPNKDDDMVKANPEKYSKLQMVATIAGNLGKETFTGYHQKYVTDLIYRFHDVYFSSSLYFYNTHSLKDKTTWRELAGIHIEYALPEGKLDPVEAATYMRETTRKCFAIGNTSFPTVWSRSTLPEVHVTMGGPNAGFTSLFAALAYLHTHPNETVWAMNWDAPSFPPKDSQINENMVLLVLAGPNYPTGRDPLAWIGLPATHASAEFEAKKDLPAAVQAWRATLAGAAANADKSVADIGYLIHDANTSQPDSAERIRRLAHVIALDAPALDFKTHTFNTPALLGEMGAGTALTNVALGIAYANHFGKNVLVAGTSDAAHPTAVLVAPPAKPRPLEEDKPWFRPRGENNAYLMWWGIRHDESFRMQGYSK